MALRTFLRLALVTATILLGSGIPAAAQSVTLAWDPSSDPGVVGYTVHYGTASRTYAAQIDVGNRTTWEVTGLDLTKNYYFAVQAYASGGLKSALSEEVTQPAAVQPGGATMSGLTASVGSPFLIGQSVTWTTAGTSPLGPVEYKFHRYSPASGWRLVQDYGPNESWTWTPTLDDLGGHALQVWVRTVGSSAPYEAWIGTPQFEVTTQPVRLTADVDFPSPPGQPVKWTASIAGATSPLEYKFLLLDRATGIWTQLRGYAPGHELTWTPGAVGTFNLQVWVREIGSTAAYQVWGGTDTIAIARTPLALSALVAEMAMPALTGTPMVWRARTKGGTDGPIEFAFYRYSGKIHSWQLVQDYSTANSYTWTPAIGDAGHYGIQVWARNAGSTAHYDAWLGSAFEVRQAPLDLTTASVFPVPPGTPVRWTARIGDASEDLEFAYFVYDQATGTWTSVRAYSRESDFTWIPQATGRYLIQVWARRVGSSSAYDVWRGSDYIDVSLTSAQINSLSANVSLPTSPGVPITWTAVGSGGNMAPLQYRFYLYTEGQGWRILRDYAPDNTFTWTPTASEAGTHALQVWVRSGGSTADYEGWRGTPLFVIRP